MISCAAFANAGAVTELGEPSCDRRHDVRVRKISAYEQQQFTGGLASAIASRLPSSHDFGSLASPARGGGYFERNVEVPRPLSLAAAVCALAQHKVATQRDSGAAAHVKDNYCRASAATDGGGPSNVGRCGPHVRSLIRTWNRRMD